MSRENLLMVADTENDADMLYAVGMFVPDPFIYLRANGRPTIVLSDLEIDRARQAAPHCRVVSLTRIQDRLRKAGAKKTGLPQAIRHLLATHRIKRVHVPDQFPFGLARQLRDLKVRVKPAGSLVFPERQLKSAAEVKKISAALMMAEVGLAEGLHALKNSRIDRKRRLVYHNNPLTSEKLRAIIDTAIIQAGGLPRHTIVAGGRQACDPHERGSGILRAHETIVIDVFPRSQKTGYFGDITRTVVRGRASDAIRKLYDTVGRGQAVAFKSLRDGARAKEVHARILEFFEREGFKTGRKNRRMHGFFHGTGHGVGLELHEGPRIGPVSKDILRSGQVVTVEPGLYYRELGGGVRLEDLALITANGPRNLTKFEKVLEV
ncbi:MAG TPA: Xaa-Pro peptidase family protein [Verrucomicrobiae bacterium]|nr:Xaa-Pro peptidase family protein [Verrucomicrobiae bacterium]